VSAEVTTDNEKSAGPEQECLGDLDDNMNIDEEVDMKIDPYYGSLSINPKLAHLVRFSPLSLRQP